MSQAQQKLLETKQKALSRQQPEQLTKLGNDLIASKDSDLNSALNISSEATTSLTHTYFASYYPLTLQYDDYSTEEVLTDLFQSLPYDIPSSFETIGHIAHMNIREEMVDYRYMIGRVILDKNIHIKSVVNKVGMIETQFRTFPLEVSQ
jgi:tRNA (guanine37-N1)-methyltransferase